jgi:methanogenic corrinoid protein MtbC1
MGRGHGHDNCPWAVLDTAMNDRARHGPITLSIAATERDTGLSKDTLRVWERRYGFPAPTRDPVGERAYPLDQVEKLRIVKRLLDAGHRPGRIVPLPIGALQALAGSTVDQPARGAASAPADADMRSALALLAVRDVHGLRTTLAHQLARLGVNRFVTDVVAPLNKEVGDAWLRGQIQIFEEHLLTETLQVVLRQAIAAIPERRAPPRVLLGTLPGEPHGLGLLMAEAILALEGADCVSLGVQTPLWDVVLAASALRADIVALGFSGCLNPNQAVDALTELRSKLPARVHVWAGGRAPVLQRRRLDGVAALPTLADIGPALRRWREAEAAAVRGAEESAATI